MVDMVRFDGPVTVGDLIRVLRELPAEKPVAIESADLATSSEICAVRDDHHGDCPRVYLQFWD